MTMKPGIPPRPPTTIRFDQLRTENGNRIGSVFMGAVHVGRIDDGPRFSKTVLAKVRSWYHGAADVPFPDTPEGIQEAAEYLVERRIAQLIAEDDRKAREQQSPPPRNDDEEIGQVAGQVFGLPATTRVPK